MFFQSKYQNFLTLYFFPPDFSKENWRGGTKTWKNICIGLTPSFQTEFKSKRDKHRKTPRRRWAGIEPGPQAHLSDRQPKPLTTVPPNTLSGPWPLESTSASIKMDGFQQINVHLNSNQLATINHISIPGCNVFAAWWPLRKQNVKPILNISKNLPQKRTPNGNGKGIDLDGQNT